MRNLLQDADRDRLAAPLVGPLCGAVAFAGQRRRALMEAAQSDFFPLDANAHAAELLLMPGLREAHRGLGDDLLDFVIALADAPHPVAHAVSPRLDLRSDDPRAMALFTPFYCLHGDLTRGELVQESRRGADVALRHGGNLVEFRIGTTRACVDVEDGIAVATAARDGDVVVLRHVSTIRARAGLLFKREVEAGTLEMRYEARGDTPVLRVTARFAAARRLTNLRISTAVDGVDAGGVVAEAARLLEDGQWRDAAPPAAPGAERWSVAKPVAHLAIGRAGWPAAAPVLHLRPGDARRVMSVTAQAMTGGALHWLVLRHGPVTLAAGESLTATEERLIADGDPMAVAAAMAQGQGSPAAAPSGLALHLAAGALLLDARGRWRERLGEARRAALLAFARRQAARLEAATGLPEIAWAAIGADALRRLGDDAAPALLARFVAPLAAAAPAALAERALVVLALARAAPSAEAAAAALPAAFKALAAASADDPRGNALCARAAGAAVLAAEAGAGVPAECVAGARELHRAAVAALRPLIRPRLGILEVHGPAGVATELQALTALALMAPDRLAFDRNAAILPA
jgi:hypothetical protein